MLLRARQAGLDAIWPTDESTRASLGSGALGGAYAVASVLSAELSWQGVVPAVRSADLRLGGYRYAIETLVLTCATTAITVGRWRGSRNASPAAA